MRTRFLLLVTAAALLASNLGYAQAAHDHAAPEKLGSVVFATSCNSQVQPQFNRAVALTHSFQFSDAIAAFNTVLAADPSCSIAYWGIALSHWGNPFAAGLKSPAQLEQGLSAVKQARVVPPKTERERAYVLEPFGAPLYRYGDQRSAGRGSLVMKGRWQLRSAPPIPRITRPLFSDASRLSPRLPIQPIRPMRSNSRQAQLGQAVPDTRTILGLAHYIIHTYDVPPLAPRAITAAERYSQIAPSDAARVASAIPYLYPGWRLARLY